MIYKTLKKVSNVCQLFIPGNTHTVAGVTITNNGDGSLTIDGTGTGSGSYTNFTTLGKNNMPYKISDKLFISAYVISGTCSLLYGGFSQSGNPTIALENPAEGTYYSGNISKQNKYESGDALGFFVGNNTFNNFRVKFNIINLTEMYGAGNEPTTVEQFRQDFPEEMYDYKPYCFVKSYKTLLKASDNNIITSYKKSLVCKTKNLFDIDSAVKVSGTSTLTKVGNQIIVSQNSRGTYISGNILLDNSLVGKTITVRATAFTSSNNTAQLRIQWSNENGNVTGALLLSNSHSGITPNDLILKGVVPEKPDDTHNNLCLMFYSNASTTLESGVTYSSTYYNIQLELGNTATEYHPYGYL